MPRWRLSPLPCTLLHQRTSSQDGRELDGIVGHSYNQVLSCGRGGEEEFFNHYKNDLKRHAHTLSGDASADLQSPSGGAQRTPTLPRPSPPLTCTIPLPNLDLPRAGRNSPGATSGLVTDPRLWPCRMRARGLASCAWHEACQVWVRSRLVYRSRLVCPAQACN
jgi:hypothetical protein